VFVFTLINSAILLSSENLLHAQVRNLIPVQQSKLTDDVNIPLTEVDSFYDNNSQSWYYGKDATHQYYSSNCKDSLVTFSTDGVYTTRTFYQYDQLNFITDVLNQEYLVSDWINQYDQQSTVLSIGCLMDYIINRSWNGISWDTLYGLRESVTYNINGDPDVRTYTMYTSGEWSNLIQIIESYDNQNQLIGEEVSLWDENTQQFELSSRTTAYLYASYTSFCNRKLSSSLSQNYVNGEWENSSIDSTSYLDNNGSFTFSIYNWNGTAFEPSYKNIAMFDEHGNQVQSTEQNWDSLSSSWITFGEFQNVYTYGNSGELIRKLEQRWACSPNNDQLAPCNVVRYSNFESCTPVTNVESINSSPEPLVFPNPTTSTINITHLQLASDATAEIINELGRVLIEQKVSKSSEEVSINLTSFPSGMYWLRLTDAGRRIIIPIVKE
jgi:hypothetical protein